VWRTRWYVFISQFQAVRKVIRGVCYTKLSVYHVLLLQAPRLVIASFSMDNKTWTQDVRHVESGTINGAHDITIPLAGRLAKYIRLQLFPVAVAKWTLLSEVQFDSGEEYWSVSKHSWFAPLPRRTVACLEEQRELRRAESAKSVAMPPGPDPPWARPPGPSDDPPPPGLSGRRHFTALLIPSINQVVAYCTLTLGHSLASSITVRCSGLSRRGWGGLFGAA